jgi:hypothetical protein
MNTALTSLLQVTASFLMLISHSPKATPAMQAQAVTLGGQVVQISTQAAANIPFIVPQNDSAWPNITDLEDAPYLEPNSYGSWTRAGVGVEVISSSTSFGDINGDGFDDAVVLVEQNPADANPNFDLAAMLNQGGIMFNIADAPLGGSAQIYNHEIQNGVLTIDMQSANYPHGIYHFILLGNKFAEVK